MTLLQAILLGIVQGATEFLPVSSSGHLVLVPSLLGWEIPSKQAFAYDILLQGATLIAVFSYFLDDFRNIFNAIIKAIKHKDCTDPNFLLGLYLVIATIPAGIIGFVFNQKFEQIFNNPKATATFLLGNAILLVVAEKAGRRNRDFSNLSWKDSILVGIFQIFALFPGISRSGVTITGGMLSNLDRQSAARFSFLISVPLILAAGLNGLHQFISLPNTTNMIPVFLLGSVVSAIVGYISIKWLLNFLGKRSLITFSIYCIIFALINLMIIAVTPT